MSGPIELIGIDKAAPQRAPTAAAPCRVQGSRPIAKFLTTYQLLAGLVVAWFWVRSGLAHITNPYYYLSSIYSYEIVGPTLGVIAAIGLPPLQLVLAAGLVLRRFVGGALFLSSMLLSVFAAAQLSALMRGLAIGCGCFGAAERRPVGGGSLAATSLLLACAISGFVCWYAGQGPRVVRSDPAPGRINDM